MAVAALDTLIAIKAINLTPGLCESDRRVGVTLIEHYNRKTGRCDPGQARLAELLGYCLRTIIRATQRLERAGLFRKVRHGGYSSRNSYAPNWERLDAINEEWKAKLHRRKSSARTEESLGSGQGSHMRDDSAVTQTCRDNRSYKTYAKRLSDEGMKQHPDNEQRFVGSVRRQADIAHTEAERRWTNDLHDKFASFPITYGEIIHAIGPDLQAAATEAEFRRRGDGLRQILQHLRIQDDR